MSDTLQEIPPSPLAELFTPEESDELATLMLSFDGGMLDYGELDGFLSALAVAPQATTLERWWTALFGPEPQWEAEGEEQRARALVERYYAMVQARVTLDLDKYRPEAIPPLEDTSIPEPSEDDYAEDDDIDDLASPAHHEATAPETYGGGTAAPGAGSEEDEDDDLGEIGEAADFDEDEDAPTDLADDEDDDEYAGVDEEDVEFGYGETWLSGFRYALSLQADDWRRVLDEEPALARWLYALWVAADASQGEGGPLDALPVMAPTAAAPEDAGFLTLEAALREHAAQFEPVETLDEDGLMTLLPILLQQLWRRHREHATAVEPEIAQQFADCLLRLRDFDEDHLFEMLRKHAGPDGMGLERLDGYWSAQQAAGLDVSPMDSLDRIFGKNKVWDDAEEASDVLKELVYHWFRLGERLRRKPDIDNPMCEPFIDVPIHEEPSAYPDRPYGQDFAQGFIDAVEELPKSAQLVLMDPEAQHWMAPLDALATGRSLAKKGARLGYDERMSLIAELPQCIAELGRFWTAGSATPREPVRAEPLPGRNDPCPCGSGKKYKKCHGAPERLN